MVEPKNTTGSIAISLLIVLATGCHKAPTVDLQELGIYAVLSGRSQHVSFREYGGGGTKRALPIADFPEAPVLRQGDYFLVYGELPAGPMGTNAEVFAYTLDANVYRSQSNSSSLDTFFTQEPMDPVRGVKLMRLTPRGVIAPGTYVLHKYVGMNGDAYLLFHVQR